MLRIKALALFFFLLSVTFAYPAVTGITYVNTVSSTFYPMDTNKQVYRFNILASADDTISSILISNTDAADQTSDISAVKAWYQPAGGVLDTATAVYLGTFTRTATRLWSLSGLSQQVVNGSSVYVTVNISMTPGSGDDCRFRILRDDVVFSSGAREPGSDVTNSSTQSVSNPGYLLVSIEDKMPEKADKGQADVYSFRMALYNTEISGGSSITVSSLRLQTVNHAGGVNMNSTLTRVRIKDTWTTYANFTAMSSTNTANIGFSTNLVIPAGGAVRYLDVYADLSGTINTYDIGLRLPQASDITNNSGYTARVYPGFGFPFATTRPVLTTAVSAVNLSRTTLMPPFVSKGQNDIKPFVLRFSHPQSLTTYSDCVITGLTLTAISNPAQNANVLFDRVRLTDGAILYSDKTAMAAANTVWLPFSRSLTITAGTYMEVTALVDVMASVTASDFYMSLSRTSYVAAKSGSSGSAITPAMASSLTSTSAVIQSAPSGIMLHHINRMPASVTKGQSWVYAEDLVFTHPNTGIYASAEIKGLTLTVENELGAGILPDGALMNVTILDSFNNTLVSYSAVPSTGSKAYIDFTNSLIIPPGSSDTVKIYFKVTGATSEPGLKLNLNSLNAVNAVDYNSKYTLIVSAESGDAFPMKTSYAQIFNPAVDIKVTHTDIMPEKCNMGQQGVPVMIAAFLNNTSGVVSAGNLRFRVLDETGNTIPASGVIGNIRIENYSNTTQVYYSGAVTTTASVLDLALSQPVVAGYSSSVPVTLRVKVDIANPADARDFKVEIQAAGDIQAGDYNVGNIIPVIAENDFFPMQSGAAHIEDRAGTLYMSHENQAAGPVQKGTTGIEVMDIAFENPSGSDASAIMITGITFTAENAGGIINASTALSRLSVYEKGNSVNLFGELIFIPSSQYVYLNFASPIIVTPSASPGNITVTVSADISSYAGATQFRLNIAGPWHVAAYDSNQHIAVTVSAKAPDTFPDMRSNLIDIQAGNKVKVLHSSLIPSTVSNGQYDVAVLSLRFSNTTDNPVMINGLTLTVQDALNAGIIPDSVISDIRIVDAAGNTNVPAVLIPAAGAEVCMTFAAGLNIAPSSYSSMIIYADIKDNTYTSVFKLALTSALMVDALPNTIIVESDSGDVFPMRSGPVTVQLKPLNGGVSHSDVIPTTVSTGQTGILAEIFNLQNNNPAESADILLTGITLTVEDETNTAINPASAIKRIMIGSDTVVNTIFTAIPPASGPFYVPFSTPARVSRGASKSLKLYIDIADTLQANTFRLNIKNSADIRFEDSNSGITITTAAINGDVFPMTSSIVIIQQTLAGCEISHTDVIQPAVNRGQESVKLMAINFRNPGSATGSNMAITRIVITVEDAANVSMVPKNALARLYVRDASGTVYGDVTDIPDYGETVSVGLTTPITVQQGALKQVFIYGNIDQGSVAAGFKIDLKSDVNVIARDSNSYGIVPVIPAGDFFPMRSSYAMIQDKTMDIQVAFQDAMPPTVNKSQTLVPVMYLEPVNSNVSGYSQVQLRGVTITVMNDSGAGIVPESVITKLEIREGASVCGAQTAIPASGSKVYIPFSVPLNLAPGAPAGLTLYADITAVTNELYFMCGIEEQSEFSAIETNSGSAVTTAAGAYPLRSGYSTILSTPGIMVSHLDLSSGQVSSGQSGFPLMSFQLANVGSFAEEIRFMTFTVKNAYGIDEDAARLFSGLYVVDDFGNTLASVTAPSPGPGILLDLGALAVNIPPQGAREMYLYADASAATFSASYKLSLFSAGDVSATACVTAFAPDVFPMETGTILMQEKSPEVFVTFSDLMPPTVSSGQADVFVMVLTASNTGTPGSASVLLTGITVTVRDAASNTVSACNVLAGFKVSDLVNDYLDTHTISASHFLTFTFPQPVTIAAGDSKQLYLTADISANTMVAAGNIKFSIDTSAMIPASDYNDPAAPIAITGVFPMESTAALVQKKSFMLKISHEDDMPAAVSTDQLNIPAMRLIFTDSGDPFTASIMVTRVNLYIQDENNLNMDPADSVKAVRITSEDGLTTYGEAVSFAGGKAGINLTAPLIVSTASNITVVARVDIASAAARDKFRMSLNAASDLYCIDANSFNLVPAANNLPDVFPMKSGVSSISPRASASGLDNLVFLTGASFSKNQKRVPLFAFRINNGMGAGTAQEIFASLTITVKDNLNNDISSSNCVESFYAVDGNSNTLAGSLAGVGSSTGLFIQPACILAAGSYVYVTIFADIQPFAAAAGFKAGIESPADISIKDINSGYETNKGAVPAFPWRSAFTPIYNAPATDLHVWHDGTLIPALCAKGQENVKLMAFNMMNPCAEGSANVIVNGVSLTAYDIFGNTLSPSSVAEGYTLTDYYGTIEYGYLTATALNSPQSAYINFREPFAVEALNTRTVYISADIAGDAPVGTVYFGINAPESIAAHNNPSGYVTVTAGNGDSFALTTNAVMISAVTYFMNVACENMMPVSAAKGQCGIKAMNLTFANINNTPVSITGLTVTVKNRNDESFDASSVIASARLVYAGAPVTAAVVISGHQLYFAPVSFGIAANTPVVLSVEVDMLYGANKDFYLELDSAGDVCASPSVNVQPAAGNQFGGMQSSAVSIQAAATVDSFHSYPNPFNPENETAKIGYYLESESEVTIKIFSVDARPVMVVAERADKAPGLHNEDIWDGKNGDKAKVRSGVYICVLDIKDKATGERKRYMRKIAVLK